MKNVFTKLQVNNFIKLFIIKIETKIKKKNVEIFAH